MYRESTSTAMVMIAIDAHAHKCINNPDGSYQCMCYVVSANRLTSLFMSLLISEMMFLSTRPDSFLHHYIQMAIWRNTFIHSIDHFSFHSLSSELILCAGYIWCVISFSLFLRNAIDKIQNKNIKPLMAGMITKKRTFFIFYLKNSKQQPHD